MPSNPRCNTSTTIFQMTMTLFFFFFCFFISTALPLHFNFPSFQPGPQNLSFVEDAYADTEALQLTGYDQGESRNWSTGRAYYEKPMHLWDKSTRKLANFTTRFNFTMYRKDQNKAGDGLAFFLAQNGSHILSPGGHLGLFQYEPAPNSTISPTVAVEFDTFRNEWDPQEGFNDHVGIDVNSIVSRATLGWPRSMSNGSTGSAVVRFSSVNKNLSVSLVFEDDPVDTTLRTFSYTLDLRDVLPEMVFVGFSAATGIYTESHKILSWEFDSTDLEVDQVSPLPDPAPAPAPSSSTVMGSLPPSRKRQGKGRKKIITALVVIFSIAVVSVVLYFLWAMILRKINENQSLPDGGMTDSTLDEEFEQDGGPKRFSYDDLAKATNGFSQNSLLGKGGFGSVYQGQLKDRSNTLAVAVKKLGKDSKQGKKEFASEVRVISRLRHRNLVKLIGWCHDNDELVLVYQFMPNGSLDTHLFGTSEQEPITWANRLKIVRGLASALLYLHEECEQCVLHRDIKSSNVMLDSGFNAKLGDFGLARVMDHGQAGIGNESSMLAGTSGYVAPECFFTFKATKESDIYSFGIVALEIACGRRPLEPEREVGEVIMVEWLWNLYNEDRILEGVDGRLNGEFDREQMVRLVLIGLWCSHPDLNHRPTIAQAISVLHGEAPLPVLPPKTISVTPYSSLSPGGSTSATTPTGLEGSDNAARRHSSPSNGGF